MIELQLKEYLQDSDAIRNRVKAWGAGYITQGKRGEAVVLQEFGRDPEYSLANESGQHRVRFQIDCYSDSPRHAESLAQLIRNRLSGYRGEIGKTEPVEIQSTQVIDAGALIDEPVDKSDKWTHRYRMDFSAFVSASIPTFT